MEIKDPVVERVEYYPGNTNHHSIPVYRLQNSHCEFLQAHTNLNGYFACITKHFVKVY